MSFYSELASTALEMLTEFGQDVTRRAVTSGTYDPATGSAQPVSTDTVRKGVILDFGTGQTLERGNLIQTNDKRLLLDANGSAPQMQDRFLVGGIEYSVISIGEINPAGTPVLFDLHLRK